jgi:hypothetical protein
MHRKIWTIPATALLAALAPFPAYADSTTPGSAYVDQIPGNVASVQQSGDANSIVTEQQAILGASVSRPNNASIVQGGSNNSVNLTQQGQQNNAAIEQDGTNDKITTTQNGTNLNLHIDQYGYSSSVGVKQFGTGGSTAVTVKQF